MLAVALGNQRIGLAVVTREHLLSFGTLEVWKGRDGPGQLEVFRQSLLRRLLTFEVTDIASVAPALGATAFTTAASELLADLAAARGLPVRRYTRAELKRSSAVGARSFHLMALRLADRHPELAHRIRARVEIPGYRGISTPHEQYHRWMFLAVAAGEQALADALISELPLAGPDS